MGLVVSETAQTRPSVKVLAARRVAVGHGLRPVFPLFTPAQTTTRGNDLCVAIHECGRSGERTEIIGPVTPPDRLHLLALRVRLRGRAQVWILFEARLARHTLLQQIRRQHR